MNADQAGPEASTRQVHLWEVVSDKELREIPTDPIDLEERLERWLESHIPVLDPNLLVVGRQVPTDFGGKIDLLCLNRDGDTVVVELKKGRTPREVTAQALDYASWAKGLSSKQIVDVADGYPRIEGHLASAFEERFERRLPDDLNLNHHALVVAESIDASTARIVRYLSSMGVPINVATVQHFRDANGRSLLAQVYLIEPEEAEARSRSRSGRSTLGGLQARADASGVGSLYAQMRNGVRGILSAQPYTDRVWYRLRRDDGSARTVLIVDSAPRYEEGGLSFRVHATRLKNQLGTDLETLKTWLPTNSRKVSLSGWPGSSEDEKREAHGLEGSFQNTDEVGKFVAALRTAITSRTA